MEGLLDRILGVAAAGQQLAKRLKNYERLLEDPVGNASARARALAEFEGSVQAYPDSELKRELGLWLAGERESVTRDQDEARFRFGAELGKELDKLGLKVRGQLPVLRAGMFSLRVDFGTGDATVFWGPEVERLKSGLGLKPAELARTLQRWTEDLHKRALEPARLRKLMAEAYRRLQTLGSVEQGTRLLLSDVLAEMVLLMQPKGFRQDPAKARFVEYPRVRFSYDLYRLRSAGDVVPGEERMRLHVANFDSTLDKTRALWVPDNEEGEGTHFSYVSFGGGER
jgi:hypothetical protein